MTFSSLHHYLIAASILLVTSITGNKLQHQTEATASLFSNNPVFVGTTNEEFCAAQYLHEAALEKDKTLRDKVELLEQNWLHWNNQQKSKGSSKSLMVTLPVVFHIIHNNGPENLANAEIIESFDFLNNAFANEAPYDPATGVNTQIQFCIAKEDPNGNPTTGINHVLSPLTELTIETEDINMKDVSRWDPTRYINIWVVKEICSNASGCGIAGYAYFPTSHGNPEDGLVVEAQWLGGTPGDATVLSHEMGHYLGLYHTFQNGCNNTNCLLDGDRVCDTPPDQSTVASPCNIDINSCTTDVNPSDPNNPFTSDQNDMFWNYMDYGEWDCYSAFTQGQAERMDFFINTVRFSLLGQTLCENPCENPMTLIVGQGDTIVNVGTTLTFPNNTIGATSFEWEVNGMPVSTATNLSYTFSPEGTYQITLNAFNGDPLCDASLTITVIAFDCEGDAHVSDLNGTDVANCGGSGNPCKTIQYALDNVLCSGDTIFIHSGNYQLPAGTNAFTPIAWIPENYSVTFYGVEDNGPVVIDGNNERRGFLYSYFGGTCPYDSPNDGINVTHQINFVHLSIQNTYEAAALCTGVYQNRGAGICILNSPGSDLTVQIQNCIFSNNTLEDLSGLNNNGRSSSGAAVYIHGLVFDQTVATTHAKVLITDADFTGNSATQNDNGGHGGAVCLVSCDTAEVRHSYFCNNSLYSQNSDSGDLNFDRNAGGALLIMDQLSQFPGHQYTVAHCTFIGNSATTANGAAFTDQSEGGAIFLTSGDGAINNTSATLRIGNCHFYDNTIETGIEHVDNNSGTLDLNSLGNNVFADELNFSLGADTTLCVGDTLFAPLLPGATYEWSTGETTSSIIINQPGTYAVTVSLGQCSAMDTVLISLENCNGSDVEICGNDLDDDNDGLIDCFDPDCCADQNCTTYYYNECDLDCPFPVSPSSDIELEIEWESNDFDVYEWCSYNTPITGDIDGDGIPEIIGKPCPSIDVPGSLPYPNLLIIDGATGQVENMILTPAFYYAMDAPAIADVDGDGFAEIFVHTSDISANSNYAGTGPFVFGNVQRRILCYEYDGTNYVERWMSAMQIGYTDDQQALAVSVADFNGDGIPELHCGNQILNSLTGELLVIGGATNHNGSITQGDDPSLSQAYAVAADVLPDDFCTHCSGLELVAGGMVYSVNIDPTNPANNTMTVEVALPGAIDGWTSIADLDKDGDLDAVVCTTNGSNGLLYAWDIQTPVAMYDQYLTPPSVFGYISQANIADFDGDGFVEIGICGLFKYQVLKPQGATFSELWSIITDDGSGSTGSSAFDFNNDGKEEIIYRTETELLVLDGPTGTVLSSQPCVSGTRLEYPVVVDVDADGETELLCSCDGKLTAFGSTSILWPRSVWNQRNYFNVNIADDLRVPAIQQQHHIVGDSVVLNNFLTMYGVSQGAFADATAQIDSVICNGGDFLLSLTICNIGDNTLPGETPIAFYNSNPTTGAADTLMTTSLGQNLLAGSCSTFVINVPSLFEVPIFVVVNDDYSLIGPYDLASDFPVTAIAECDYTNNIDSFLIPNPEPPVLDLGPDTLICDNGVLSLQAGSGFDSYLWFDGSTDSTNTIYGPGEYWVAVSSICGVQRDTIEVFVEAITDIMLPPQVVLCGEACTTLEVSEWFDSYQWIPSDYLDCANCATVVACPPVATTYIVIGSSNLGCFSIDTITVIPVQPMYTVLDTAICLGDVVEFNGVNYPIGTTEIFTLPGELGCMDTIELNVTWNGGQDAPTLAIDALVCDNEVFIFDGVEIAPNSSQTFNYQTYLGCDSVIIVGVGALPTYETNLSETICMGDSILIFGNYETAPGVYNMTFTSTENCDSVVNVTLGFYSAMTLVFSVEPTCPAQSDGFISSTVSGGAGNYSYLWSNGATTATISNLAAGLYTVTVTDGNSCIIEGSAMVDNFQADPTFELSDPTCNGTATGGIVVTNAEPGWMFALNDNPFQADPFFNGLEAGQYLITIIDENGCEIVTVVALQAPPAIVINGLPNEIEVFVDETYTFPAEVSGIGPYLYSWSPTTGLSCPGMSTVNCLHPTVSGITEETTYTLTVSIPGNENCFEVASITVIPKIQCDGTYALPNAFTPNGDGQNDVFRLLHQDNGIRVSSFTVFDRWGEMVYEGEGDSAGWNGTYKGKPMPMDSYIYQVKLICPDGVDVRELMGDVSLVR